MTDQNEKEPIIDALEALKEDPPRDPARARQTRQHFLDQVEEISRQPVSIPWFSRLNSVFRRSEPQFRLSTLTIAIFLGLLLISFSGSVVAARQALPDQFLYPYKLWLENRRLDITFDPDARIQLHLDYAEERLAELESLGVDLNDPAYTDVRKNYEDQLDAAGIQSEDQYGTEELETPDILQEQASATPEPEEDPDKEDLKETEDLEETLEPVDTSIDDEDGASESEETTQPEESQEPGQTSNPDDSDDSNAPNETEGPDDDALEQTIEPSETEEP